MVEGTAFKLVDKDGKVRGSWDLDKDEASLEMTDTKGRTRVGIVVKNGPFIKLWGEKGKDGVTISQDETRGSWIVMCDQDGNARLDAQVHPQIVIAEIRDRDNKIRMISQHDVIHSPEVKLLNKDGSVLWTTGDKDAAPADKGK